MWEVLYGSVGDTLKYHTDINDAGGGDAVWACSCSSILLRLTWLVVLSAHGQEPIMMRSACMLCWGCAVPVLGFLME